MNELEHYIQTYFGVTKDDIKTIENLFTLSYLQKGEYFLSQDTYCQKLSFIKSGCLRVYANTEDKEVTQWISSDGSFITDLSSLIFETPSRFNIQALSDTELYTIHKENYLKIGRLVPRWHELEKLFIAKCFTMLEDRMFRHLSMSAEDRYDYFFNQNPTLFNQVPLQYIASMLGMTPETFSRIRKKRLS